jgi:hypothetical protein
MERARNARELQAFATTAEVAGRLTLLSLQSARPMVPLRPRGAKEATKAGYSAWQWIICPLLADLRPASVKFGGDVAQSTITLDACITTLTNNWETAQSPGGLVFRIASEGGLHEDLDEIERQAKLLMDRAASARVQSEAEILAADRELDRLDQFQQ